MVTGFIIDKSIRRGRQPESFRGQAPDAFTVHGQSGCTRRWDHLQTMVLFQINQGLGVDGLDFGNHQMRPHPRDEIS
jgi:hypothetical protein